jgi:hypothetical protein
MYTKKLSQIIEAALFPPPSCYQGRQACSSTDSSVTSAFTMVAGADKGRGIGEQAGSFPLGDREQRIEGQAERPRTAPAVLQLSGGLTEVSFPTRQADEVE